MEIMDDLDLDGIATELRTKATELRASIEELSRSVKAGATIDLCKRIGEVTEQSIQQVADMSTAESLQRTLNEVHAAQQRLEAGSFGRCVVCGEHIPLARLEFRPWAATCVDHTD